MICGFGRTALAGPEQAEDLVRQGVQLRRKAHDSEALERFRQAYALSPAARIRAQIGLAEQALGQWVDAEGDLVEAMRDSEDPWVARNTAVLERSLHDVRGHLASVGVEANVRGAELWIDGVMRGKLPLGSSVRVVAGALTIAIVADGFERIEQKVTLPPGAEFYPTITLHALQPAGTLVEVPGQEPVTAPAQMPPPASPRRVPLDMPPCRASALKTPVLGWALLGTSAAFLAGGVVATFVAGNNASVYNDDGRCLYGDLTRSQRCGAYRDRAEAASALAIAGYALAAGTGVASTIVFLTHRSQNPPTAPLTCSLLAMSVGCRAAF
jgi:hypothetical protein